MIVRIQGREVLYVDIEASSLGEGSFPIEVGWCVDDDVAPESFLVASAACWNTAIGWSAISQRLHGISLEDLRRDGIAARSAVIRIEAAFGRRMVVSDNPAFDDYWLSMIYEAACLPKTWTLHSLDEVHAFCIAANPIAAIDLVRVFASVDRAYPHPHRAGPDALRMAKRARALADPVFREARLAGDDGRHPR
jgi:predicted small integral membrane protein